jgi:phosphatidylserine decarboxylase
MTGGNPEPPIFQERLTSLVVADAWRFALPLWLVGGFCLGAGFGVAGWLLNGLGLFVLTFFRNPRRVLPEGAGLVLSPADGRVLQVGEIEAPDGTKVLRIGIFLSVFDVHVNRAPVAGRVVSIERSGDAYLAAFNRDAETRNVSCGMLLETAAGLRVRVTQITGLIARRIICQPQVGDRLERGVRYGLIRFGSRTDVWLPAESRALVSEGDRVHGGSSVLAELPGAGA